MPLVPSSEETEYVEWMIAFGDYFGSGEDEGEYPASFTCYSRGVYMVLNTIRFIMANRWEFHNLRVYPKNKEIGIVAKRDRIIQAYDYA